MPLETGGSISAIVITCWTFTTGCRQQLRQRCVFPHTETAIPGTTAPRRAKFERKMGKWMIGRMWWHWRGIPKERGWNPSKEKSDREGSTQSKNRTSVKKVCRCVKDSRARGRQERPCESPEAIKVIFLVHSELGPTYSPLFSADWRAPPCVLTASLCESRKTFNSLTTPQGK